MSIHKRMNKEGRVSYMVRYREHGRQRCWTFASRKDANAFEAQVQLNKRTGTIKALDAGKIVLSEFGELWWDDHVMVKLQRATQLNYAQVWNLHVLPHLGQMKLRDITPRVIEKWRADLERDGLGKATVKKSMNVLQSCLQRAVIWDEITKNPVKEIRKPSGKREREIRPVTPEEIEGIRKHLISEKKYRDATLVSVLAYSGLRPGEALGLTWEHIRNNTILVEQTVTQGKIKNETKTGKSRSVKLLPALRHDLMEWRLRSEASEGLIFPNRTDGGPWKKEAQKSWGQKAFKRAAASIGRDDITPYQLRHSFASLLLHEGRSVVEVAAQLGHAPTMTLDTYAHLFADLDDVRHPANEIIEAAREDVRKKKGAVANKNVVKLFAKEKGTGRLTA